MADKKISELDSALQINDDAAFPFSQLNGGQQTTFKAVITALAVKIAEGITFSNLLTEAKTLVGAINEVSQGGGGGGAAIFIGTSTPSSSQGSNGNLYIQYTEGTGGADDTVDALYVKLDGAWCEISTGGVTESIESTIDNVAIATFPDGADNVPVKSLEVEIEPSLSGVSSVNVIVNAKNFVSDNLINGQIGNNGGYTSSTNRITNAINESPYLSHTFLKKGTYTLSISGLDYCTLLTKDKDNNILDNFAGSWNSLPFTFTLTQDGYVLFTARLSSNADISPSSYNAQIEIGSTATTYEQYNGTTYPISLGGTYYGGTLDVTNGVLTVKYARVDLGSLGWNTANYGYYTNGISSFIKPVLSGVVSSIITENYLTVSRDTIVTESAGTNHIAVSQQGNLLVSSATTPSGYATYELATPTVITGLSETQVKTLLGNNNIFADCGNVDEVTYFNINADELADLISVYSNLNALSDVDISNPTNNQVLIYNATTKKWENGTIASGGGHTYSTSEQIVGEWIDGSTIYEQTIYVDSFPNNTSKDLTTPANLNLLIDSFGFMKSKLQTGYFRTLPFAAGGTNDVRIDLNGGTLRAVTFSDWSSYDGYITIRYTKSTQ